MAWSDMRVPEDKRTAEQQLRDAHRTLAQFMYYLLNKSKCPECCYDSCRVCHHSKKCQSFLVHDLYARAIYGVPMRELPIKPGYEKLSEATAKEAIPDVEED